MVTKLLYVAGLGLVGVFARFGCMELAGRISPSQSAANATLAVNVIGSFVIGVVYVLADLRGLINPELRAGLMIGLLGGFTTFSSYSLDVARAMDTGDYFRALSLFILGPTLGLIATFVGIAVTSRFAIGR